MILISLLILLIKYLRIVIENQIIVNKILQVYDINSYVFAIPTSNLVIETGNLTDD